MAEEGKVEKKFRATLFLDENFSFLNDSDGDTESVDGDAESVDGGGESVDKSNDDLTGRNSYNETKMTNGCDEIKDGPFDGTSADPMGGNREDVCPKRQTEDSDKQGRSGGRGDKMTASVIINQSFEFLDQLGASDSESTASSDVRSRSRDSSFASLIDDDAIKENAVTKNVSSDLKKEVSKDDVHFFLESSSKLESINVEDSSGNDFDEGQNEADNDTKDPCGERGATSKVLNESTLSQSGVPHSTTGEDYNISCPIDNGEQEENAEAERSSLDDKMRSSVDNIAPADSPLENNCFYFGIEENIVPTSGQGVSSSKPCSDSEFNADSERTDAAERDTVVAENKQEESNMERDVDNETQVAKCINSEKMNSKEANIGYDSNEIESDTGVEGDAVATCSENDNAAVDVESADASNHLHLEEHTENFYFGLEDHTLSKNESRIPKSGNGTDRDKSESVPSSNSELGIVPGTSENVLSSNNKLLSNSDSRTSTLSNSGSRSSNLSNPNSRTSTLSNHGSRTSTLSSQDKRMSEDSSSGSLRLPVGHQRTDSVSTTKSERDSMVKYYAQRQHIRRIDRQDSVTTYKRLTRKFYDVEKVVTLEKTNESETFGFHLLGGSPAYVITVTEGGIAQRCGVCVNDMLITVNGIDTMASSVEEVARIILTTPNKVVLGLSRCTSPLTPEAPPLKSGYLHKLSGSGLRRVWKKRWVELKQDYCLYHYKTDKDKAPLGVICLGNFVVTKATELDRPYAFKLAKYEQKTYHFAAKNEEEMTSWANAITTAAENRSKTLFTLASGHNISIPALAIKDPECVGHMTKQGNSHKTWKKRYFVLKDASLYYYKDVNATTAKGVAQLHGYTIDEDFSHKHKPGFTLNPPLPRLRKYYFYVENTREKERWIAALRKSIEKWQAEEEPLNS